MEGGRWKQEVQGLYRRLGGTLIHDRPLVKMAGQHLHFIRALAMHHLQNGVGEVEPKVWQGVPRCKDFVSGGVRQHVLQAVHN